MKGNYLQQKRLKKSNSSNRDYSLSNNNLTVEELLSVIKSTDIEKLCGLMTTYPDFRYGNLKKAIRNYYGVNKIVLGSGSEELIVRINNYFNIKNKKVGLLVPNFYRIKETIKNYTAFQTEYNQEDLFFGFSSMEKVDLIKKIDALWISNPNPIIGKICRESLLKKLIKNNPEVIFIIDESAMDLLKESSRYSLLNFSNTINNLIVIKSFSKLFGLAGLRIGFATGKNKILDRVNKSGPTFPVNSLADFILCKMLKNKSFVKKTLYKIHANKEKLEKILKNELNLNLSRSSTNCIFINTKNLNILTRFKAAGIVPLSLKDQEGVINSDMIRITVHSSKKIFDEFLTKLEKIIKGGKK